jgi:hypothetical protein
LVLDQPNISKDKLPDFIGKEAADRVLNHPTSKAADAYNGGTAYHILENEDLKIGGEGMHEFYDKMLPKAVEKIGKQHGVKVRRGAIDQPGGIGEWDYKGPTDLTPQQIRAFAQTSPYGTVSIAGQLRVISEAVARGMPVAEAVQTYGSYKAAEAMGGELTPRIGKAPVHYFDVPPSLKQAAQQKGMPLFSGGKMLIPVDHQPDFGDDANGRRQVR